MKTSETSYFKESLALLKILSLGQKDLEEGRTKPFRSAFADIRARITPPLPTSPRWGEEL